MAACWEWMTQNLFGSSSAHRNAQRANAAADVGISTIGENTPGALITGKIGQIGVSAYSLFFRRDVYFSERVFHGIQLGVAAAQVGIEIALMYMDEDCLPAVLAICTTRELLKYVYGGVLLFNWVPGEVSKRNIPQDDIEQQQGIVPGAAENPAVGG